MGHYTSEAVARRPPELAPDLQPRRRNDRQARTERGGGTSPALRRSRRRTRVEDVDVNGDIKRRILDPRPHALHDLGEPLALEVHGGDDTEAEALVVQPSPPRREASPRTGIDGSGSTPSPDTSTPWPGRRSARGRFWPDGPSARKRSGSPRRLSRSCTSPWVRRMRRYFGSGKRDGSRTLARSGSRRSGLPSALRSLGGRFLQDHRKDFPGPALLGFAWHAESAPSFADSRRCPRVRSRPETETIRASNALKIVILSRIVELEQDCR